MRGSSGRIRENQPEYREDGEEGINDDLHDVRELVPSYPVREP
jgi:hypothetical protein